MNDRDSGNKFRLLCLSLLAPKLRLQVVLCHSDDDDRVTVMILPQPLTITAVCSLPRTREIAERWKEEFSS